MKTKMKIKRGSILVLAIIMVVILLIIGLALITLGQNSRLQAIRSQHVTIARTAADTGMTKAVKLMRKKLTDEGWAWNNATLPAETGITVPGTNPASNTTYTYTITGNPTSGFDITSTGTTVNNVQRTVHKKVVFKSAWFGIGVDESLDLGQFVDFGVYPDTNTPLKLQSNGTDPGEIYLFPNCVVPGDVVCGPGGDPESAITQKPGASAQYIYAAEEPIIFSPVIVPSDLTNPATRTAYAPEPNITGDRHYFGNVQIDGTQNIKGNVRIFIENGTLDLRNASQLVVKAGGSLELYLDGDLDSKYGGVITNENNNSTTLMIFGTSNCESIYLKNSTALHCAIYAPNAELMMDNGAGLYGAYIGKTFQVKNSGIFKFDTRLLDIFGGLTPRYLATAQGSWWEE